MKPFQSFALKLGLLFSSLFASSFAFAGPGGGTVNTGVTSVPTLSGTMLILLSLLLFVVAFKVAKQKHGNSAKFFVTLMGAAALFSIHSGVEIIQEARAISPPQVIQLVPSQSSYRVVGERDLRNDSGQVITINSIIPDEGSTCQFIVGVGAGGLCDKAIPSDLPMSIPSGKNCVLRCGIEININNPNGPV